MKSRLRIYLLQQWFNLSDPAMEEMLIDSESMRRFAGINLMDDPVPDETAILKFRHLLEKHGLTEQLFQDVGLLLTERGLLLHQGTIVDATIISAPPSTKNRDRAGRSQGAQRASARRGGLPTRRHCGRHTGPRRQRRASCTFCGKIARPPEDFPADCFGTKLRAERSWPTQFGHAGGATFRTSSAVVRPAATFIAPETRSGFMPSLYACSRIARSSASRTTSLRSAGVISMIS